MNQTWAEHAPNHEAIAEVFRKGGDANCRTDPDQGISRLSSSEAPSKASGGASLFTRAWRRLRIVFRDMRDAECTRHEAMMRLAGRPPR